MEENTNIPPENTDDLSSDKPGFIDEPDMEPGDGDKVTKISGMYQDWFLDYASYVILERAVPEIL
jgi:topoisomerase IV subunit A